MYRLLVKMVTNKKGYNKKGYKLKRPRLFIIFNKLPYFEFPSIR